MASKSSVRRWILIVLIALGVVVVATLPRGATDDTEQDADSAEASATEQAPAEQPAPNQAVDGGLATRRVIEGCDPVVEATKYRGLVNRRALAILRWNNMSGRAAKLKIPVHVNGTENGAVAVSILQIPMRTQYLNIWMSSGHIERGPGDTFLLDPCSAWIEPWEAMDRAQEENQ